MKLLLINPSKYDENGRLLKFKQGTFPPLNLLILASIASRYENMQIKIVDEFIEAIPVNEKFDLVGITTLFTSSFPRVKELSMEFRKKGSLVVLGGTHATCNPEDCTEIADSIVIGEAEVNFVNLLNDFLSTGKIQPVYRTENFVDFNHSGNIIPDYSFIDLKKYFQVGFIKKSNIFLIESSRGCPMSCDFCCVRITRGLKPRFRPVEAVVSEIQMLKKKYNAKHFSFADDNFLVDFNHSKELLTELAKLDIKFFCEISTRIVEKPELLSLLNKAGCNSALLGIESLNVKSLNDVRKSHNKVNEYQELFSIFNKYNIPVMPSFIFGLDYDNGNTFKDVFDFLKKVNAQRALFNILTPFPGTGLYNQMKGNNRILTDNLSLYDVAHVVFQPKLIQPSELENDFWALYQKFYSSKEIYNRILKSKKSDLIYLLFASKRFKKLVDRRIFPFSSGVNQL